MRDLMYVVSVLLLLIHKINSARLVDVVLAFEDTFDIEVADEDADAVETVGDAVRLIQSKLA